ncbi:MAG: hypothetical protein H6618_05060 [Deltaproteobacteria bacterium]|nr:hypothetical protein [Deltaproteobacteria bacterium]
MKIVLFLSVISSLMACMTRTPLRETSSRKLIKADQEISFVSRILGEERAYRIHLPASYSDPSIAPKYYPVLYVLDGEDHFSYASGIVDFMSRGYISNNYQIPELIVVAVLNKSPGKDNRFRDYSPSAVPEFYSESGGGDNFLRFLREELAPAVDKEYRTLPFRVLAGHSMGGLIATYDMLKKSSIFNAFIAMDPSLWWDDGYIQKIANNLEVDKLRGAYYLSTYGKARRKKEYEAFVELLFAKNPDSLRTHFHVLENEQHSSLPVVSLYNGLRHVFDGFKPDLSSLAENPDLIDLHFEKFSRIIGVKYLPPEDLIHMICMETARERPEQAVDCFIINTRNYPDSYNAFNALAKAYASMNKTELALKAFRRSLEIAPNNRKALVGTESLINQQSYH